MYVYQGILIEFCLTTNLSNKEINVDYGAIKNVISDRHDTRHNHVTNLKKFYRMNEWMIFSKNVDIWYDPFYIMAHYDCFKLPFNPISFFLCDLFLLPSHWKKWVFKRLCFLHSSLIPNINMKIAFLLFMIRNWEWFHLAENHPLSNELHESILWIAISYKFSFWLL
jgi:hypothetical protein